MLGFKCIIFINKKLMYNTFNLDNMESYFRNYIPCDQHRR